MRNEDKLNALIDMSHNVELKEDDWYSWANQRRYTYTLARELLIHAEDEPAEAVRKAVAFHKEFYNQVIKY